MRRALATSGPTTANDLAISLWLPLDAIAKALAALEAKGAVFRGHFTARPGHDATDDHPQVEEWCDRYVLERIHRQTLNTLRAEVEPCADHEFAAFRLAWNHLGAATLEPGPDAVRTVLEQLAGLAFPPDFWESAILPPRIRDYRPEHLDLLCLSGEFAWVAAPMEDDAGPADQFPTRVAFVPRRGGLFLQRDRRTLDPADERLLTTMRDHGAQYLDQIADRANLPERDALAGLWRLAAVGAVSNDSFAPLRLIAADPGAARTIARNGAAHAPTRHDAAVRARLKSSLSGRWSLVASGQADGQLRHEAAATDRVRDFAMLLLARHGILAREMLALEQFDL
ncbi:MAG: Lhr family ATP-dependent helicase, partial [Candidatus Binataceae bacterium]